MRDLQAGDTGTFDSWSIDVYGTAAGSDSTPPTTTVSGADHRWHNSDVNLTLSATDNPGGSGVDRTLYKIGGGPWQTGTTVLIAAPKNHGDDGRHRVSYYSVDKAGNREAVKSCTVKIDTRGPHDSRAQALHGGARLLAGAQLSGPGRTEPQGRHHHPHLRPRRPHAQGAPSRLAADRQDPCHRHVVLALLASEIRQDDELRFGGDYVAHDFVVNPLGDFDFEACVKPEQGFSDYSRCSDTICVQMRENLDEPVFLHGFQDGFGCLRG